MIRTRVAETSGALVARHDVIRPDGTTACTATTNVDLDCPLNSAATYAIFVSDNAGTQTGNYSIAIRRLDLNAGCTVINYGAPPLSGTIGAAAKMDCFRFTGAPGENVRIEFDGTLSFGARELFRPDGTEVSPCCVLDAAGTHRIIVGSFIGTGTGNYSISIQRLSNPVGCTSIAFGDPPASGAVSGLADMDCVTFTGSLGDAIDIHTVSVDVAEIDLQLYDPSGRFVCSSTVGALEGR